MKRRTVLKLLGVGAVGAGTGWYFWPDEGFGNPCSAGVGVTPDDILNHDLVRAAWDGIDPQQVWDCHTHLVGNGDSQSGIWLHESMQDVFSPLHYVRYRFYLNASCVDQPTGVDQAFVTHLMRLLEDFPPSMKCMLLAFDHHYREDGQQDLQRSPFSVADSYAARIATQHPDRFEWIASIHPYRPDCVIALEQAVQQRARAIKWLPPVMGIDPSSPRCDRFYQALARLNIPLLSHAGDEHAVAGVEAQSFGNPLLLRRALDHGVRVIVAHCASQGANTDLDKGENAQPVDNFRLFARMMDEVRYEGLLYGDISAMTQLNRIGEALDQVVQRQEWHHRLLNGSDYPLPGVMPLYSNKVLYRRGYITKMQAVFLAQLRHYNPLLYDFVLKRSLRVHGKALSASVFQTREFFSPTTTAYSPPVC